MTPHQVTCPKCGATVPGRAWDRHLAVHDDLDGQNLTGWQILIGAGAACILIGLTGLLWLAWAWLTGL